MFYIISLQKLFYYFHVEMQSYLLNLRTQAEECEEEDHPGWGVNPKCKQKGCNQVRCNLYYHVFEFIFFALKIP